MVNKMKKFILLTAAILAGLSADASAQSNKAQNPLIYADVPDVSMVRVGNNYYMSSTTMHMVPGVPIMKSTDLSNWKTVNYAYDILTANLPSMNLEEGKNTYGQGSWASCIRYHNGKFYLSTFAQTTNKTYFFITEDLENGPWERIEFSPAYHDLNFFFEEDGKIYMVYGNGRLFIAELKGDLSGVVPGTERVLIENASAPAGNNIMLGAEGSQLFKVNGKYYLFNITWPRNSMRTVIVHRADKITGPYEGKVVFLGGGFADNSLFGSVRRTRDRSCRLAVGYGIQGRQDQTGDSVRDAEFHFVGPFPFHCRQLCCQHSVRVGIQSGYRRALLHSRWLDGRRHRAAESYGRSLGHSRDFELCGGRNTGHSKRLSYSGKHAACRRSG